MDTAIAIYGAALATLLAVGQGISAFKHRAHLGIEIAFSFGALIEHERDQAHGTPVQVKRGGDCQWKEALLRLTVRNEGGIPIQIVAVIVESIRKDGELTISQFAPEPLPYVLEPGTRIQVLMQKEPIDMLDNITFLGVMDALGNRYRPGTDEIREIVQQSWGLPTRVQRYIRRDDPTAPPVLAYQNRERSAAVETNKSGKKAVPLVRRQSSS